MKTLIPMDRIERRIYLIRGARVMLDRDLAELYGVSTKVLNQAVKRHINRFPPDFMFQLSSEEMRNWLSQIVIPNSSLKMGLRWRPYAFTEQGVANLSSVLNSERAVQVNIEIIRAFVRMRRLLASHSELARRLAESEKNYDAKFIAVFDAIRAIMATEEKPKPKIGFIQGPEQG